MDSTLEVLIKAPGVKLSDIKYGEKFLSYSKPYTKVQAEWVRPNSPYKYCYAINSNNEFCYFEKDLIVDKE